MASLKTHTKKTQLADAILGIRASYAYTLSLVERVLGHFMWDPGPMSVTINRQKR